MSAMVMGLGPSGPGFCGWCLQPLVAALGGSGVGCVVGEGVSAGPVVVVVGCPGRLPLRSARRRPWLGPLRSAADGCVVQVLTPRGVVGCVGLCWWQLVVGSGWWRVGRPVGGDGGEGFQAGLLVLHRWALRSRTSGVRVRDSGDGWGRGPASTAFCSAPVHDCCGWVRCAQLRMVTACRYSPTEWCCWESWLRLVRPGFRVGGRTSCR